MEGNIARVRDRILSFALDPETYFPLERFTLEKRRTRFGKFVKRIMRDRKTESSRTHMPPKIPPSAAPPSAP